MSKTKRVIVVTNAFLLSSGMESLMLELSGMLVDQVYNGTEKKLIEKIIGKKPDFVIIDPASVKDNLISIIRTLNNEEQIKVIGIISLTEKPSVKSKFANIINTQWTKYQLINALKNIIGHSAVEQQNNGQVISKRETEILKHLALGLTNQEVADKLFLSIHTVMTHRKTITRKLGIKTIAGLTVYALMNKLVDIREVERMK